MNNTIDAKTRTARAATLPPHAGRLRRKLLPLSLSLLLTTPFVFGGEALAAAVGATTTPTGGTVVGGIGSITQNGANTVINQNSAKLALDWQTFNVGKDASVLFKQPSFTAVALNRILDQNPSQIFGHITSNGQVFLINTHGIIFGASAQMNVGGLMASTLDLTPKDFLASRYNLDAHGVSAGIVNHGLIKAASGGSVSLVGGSVANDGVILANYGRINLDGADRAVLDFDGNGLINIQVTGALKQRLDSGEAAVSNKGTLKADSGTVVLQAAAAKDLFTNLVNNSGVIDAGSISTQGGVVRLVAAGGHTENSGAINVSGVQGGSVQLLSDRNVSVTGSVDASGSHGGGSIRVGGGYQGGEGLQAAAVTYVGPDARLNADAVESGNGGSVVLWSNTATGFKGNISARGGATGGNGGMAEVSSRGYLAFDGLADLRAPHGAWGTLLLDPNDITISDGADDNPADPPGGFDANGDFTAGDSTAASTINTATIVTQLGSSDVNIKTADGDITVANGFTYDGDDDRTLTLDAAGTLTFKNGASIESTGGTDGTHTLGGDLTGAGGVVFETGSSFITNGGDLGIKGGAFTLGGALDAGAGTVTLNSTGAISQTDGVITAGTLTGSSTGDTTLGGDNAIAALGDFTAANFTLNNAATSLLTLGGTLEVGAAAGSDPEAEPETAGNINVMSAGAITQGPGGAFDTHGGDITLTGNALTLGVVDARSSSSTPGTAGNVVLNATGGAAQLGRVEAGSLEVTAAGDITQASAAGDALHVSGTSHFAAGTHDITLGNTGNQLAGYVELGGGNVTLANDTATLLSDTHASGALDLQTNGTLTQVGGVIVDGTATFTQNSTDADDADITLGTDNASLNGDVVFAGAIGNLTLHNQTATPGALTLPGSVAGNLTLKYSDAALSLPSTDLSVGGALEVMAAGGITLQGDVTTAGGQNYASALTLGHDVTLTDTAGQDIKFSGTVDGGYGLTVSTDGLADFAGAVGGSGSGLTSLTTGAVRLGGNVTTTGAQAYGGTTTIFSGTPVVLTTTDNAVTFGGTLDNSSDAAQALTVNAGSGVVTFTGAVGSGVHHALGDLVVNSSGLTDFKSTVQAASLTTDAGGSTKLAGNVTTAGKQTYHDAVVLDGDLTLETTGDDLVFGATVDNVLASAPHALTVKTNGHDLTFTGAVGSLNGPLQGLTTSGRRFTANSTLDIGADGLDITTALDGIGQGGAFNVAGQSTFNAGSTGTINLGNTGNHFADTVDLTGGSATITDSGSLTLGTLDIGGNLAVTSNADGSSTGDLDLGGGSIGGDITATSNGGAITQTAALTVSGDSDFSAGNNTIALNESNDFTGAVSLANSGAHDVTLNNGSHALTLGAVTLGSGALNLAGGQLTLGGDLSTAGGAINFSGPVMLAAVPITIDTTGAGSVATGAAITFGDTLDGGAALTLTAGSTGEVSFGDVVGGTIALGSLSVDAGGGIVLGSSVRTTGAQAFNNALTLAGDTTLVSTSNGDITLGKTVTGGGHSLGVNTGGLTRFDGAVTGVTTLTTDAAGSTRLGAAITTSGTQTYHDAVTLGGDTALKTTNSAITFGGTVDNDTATARGLTVDAGSGVVTFSEAVGSGIHGALDQLTSTGGSFSAKTLQIGSGGLSITTTAAGIGQTGAFTVAGASHFDSGAHAIMLNQAGNYFGGAVSLTSTGDGDVTLNSGANLLTLGDSSVGTGALTLTATGITQSGTDALVQAADAGIATLDAGSGALALGNSGNDFTGAVAATGSGVVLADANDLNIMSVDNLPDHELSLSADGVLSFSTAGGIDTGSANLTLISKGGLLSTGGPLNGADISLTGKGVTLNDTITASGTLNLNSTDNGAINQADGIIVASVLSGNSGTGNVTLNKANLVDTLQGFDAGDFSLVNAQKLTVDGARAGDSIALTTTAGDLSIDGTITGSSVALSSAGIIDEGAGGAITADTLTGSSVGHTGLDGANAIGALGDFSATGFSVNNTGDIAINGDLNVGSGEVTLTSDGAISEGASGIITAGTLTGSSVGTTVLGGANAVDVLGSFSATSFNLVNAKALTVTGPLTVAGNTDLRTTVGNLTVNTDLAGDEIRLRSAGSLSLDHAVAATAVNLVADTGSITQGIDGLITAGTLEGTSGTNTTLLGGNQVGALGEFTTGGNFSFTSAQSLTLNNALTANGGSGNITLSTTGAANLVLQTGLTGGKVTLSAGGSISQDTAGIITSNELVGTSGGSTALDGENVVGILGNFVTGGDFSFNSAQSLTVSNSLSANGGAGNITLTTTGTDADLILGTNLAGGTVSLGASGNISQTSGAINAGTLQGAGAATGSAGSTVLGNSNNSIGILGDFNGNGFSLKNAGALAVNGNVDGGTDAASVTTGTGSLNVGTTGSISGASVQLSGYGSVGIAGVVNSGAGTTTLVSSTDSIAETGSGSITAGTLAGNAAGAINLLGTNHLDNVGNLAAGTALSLNNAKELNITGTVTAANGAVAIATTAGALNVAADGSVSNAGAAISLDGHSALSIAGTVDSGAGSTTLTSAGAIDGSGIVKAGQLSGTSGGATALTGANRVGILGGFTTGGDFSFTQAGSLAIDHAISAHGGAGNVTLTTTGAGSDLTLISSIEGATVSLKAGGALTQTTGLIHAATLSGQSSGNTTLTGANQVGALGAFTSGGNFSFNNVGSLTLNSTLSAHGGTGQVTLSASGAGANLILATDLSASGLVLTAGGAIRQTGGILTADTLTGTSIGETQLGRNNKIRTLNAFSAASFALVNAQALTVTGPVATGGNGDISLTTLSGALQVKTALGGGVVTLDSATDLQLTQALTGATVNLRSGGNIGQDASAIVTANTLIGASAGSTQLGGANKINALGNFDANGFALSNTQALTVTGVVNGGASAALTTTQGGLQIDGTVSGTKVALHSAGAIAKGAAAVLSAGTLSGSSVGTTTLDGINHVATLGDFTAAGFSLKNADALVVSGAVDGGNLAQFETTGNLAINGAISGTTVALNSTAAISQGASGRITATTLSGRSTGATALTGANRIDTLGGFNANGFSLSNGKALTVAGPVNGGGTTTLGTTAGDLAINGLVYGDVITLRSGGAINEGTGGLLVGTTLHGKSGGDTVLGNANKVAALGSFAAANLDLTNAQALAINGPLTIADGGRVHLTTTSGLLSVNTALSGGDVALTSAGDLVLTQAVKGSTVALVSGGDISQTASGIVTAGMLTGRSVGSTMLDRVNHVDALGSFHADGFALATDRALTVTGPVDGGGDVTLGTTRGDLTINGSVSGTRTTLTSAGAIKQGATGGIAASTLSGSSTGATTLDGSGNRVATLSDFKAAGFSFTDGQSLVVAGPLDGGARTTLTTTRGGDLSIDGALRGGVTTLVSAGAISEGSGGSIAADTLTGSAVGVTTLGDAAHPLANYIGTLGGFSAPAGFSLTNSQTLTLASVNGSGYTVDAGNSPTYLSVIDGDLLQVGTTWLYNGLGTWSSTGHIGVGSAPIYVIGGGTQTIAEVGLPPAYFYALDRQGDILPLTGGSSVNVPTSALTSRAQNTNNHTDSYIDPSVVSANYRAFGIVPSGLLLPPDQQRCPPDATDCEDE